MLPMRVRFYKYLRRLVKHLMDRLGQNILQNRKVLKTLGERL